MILTPCKFIYPSHRTTAKECTAFNYVYLVVKIYIQQVETITECMFFNGSDGLINTSMSNDFPEMLGNTFSTRVGKNTSSA
jgi:hypothetical protein